MIPSGGCQPHCATHQLSRHVRGHGPTNYLACEQVQHDCKVQPAAASPDIGNVRHPGLVRRLGFKLSIQYTLGSRQVMVAIGGVLKLRFSGRAQAVGTHQTADFIKA